MKKFSNQLQLEKLVKELFNDLKISHRKGMGEENILDEFDDTSILYIDEEDSRNGRVWVEDGKLKFIAPRDDGKWPFIRPGANITLMKSGKVINNAIMVTSDNDITIKVKEEPAKSQFYLYLSEDETEIFLETKFQDGKRYYLGDMEEEFILTIGTEEYDTIPAPVIDDRLIYQELAKMRVSLEIDREAVSKACNSRKDSKVLIVKGRPATPPIDGKIKYMFESKERILRTGGDTEKTIDFYDRGDINSVEEGDVLAILIPPISGKEGLNVRGEIIDPPEADLPKLLVGDGAKISDDGKTVFATRNGRPVLVGRNKIISVISQMIIRSDVDINTGHINFKGDLIIQGNVTEGFEVNALGRVYIQGGVYHGRVYSETGIYINRNLIGGFISGGGETARYRRLLPFLKRLQFILNGIMDSYVQLVDNPKFSTKDLEQRGIGYFIKIILEMRFPEIPELFKEIQGIRIEEQGEEASSIWDALQIIGKKLVGLGPLEIANLEEIHKYEEFLEKAINSIVEGINKTVDVEVGACQNTVIEATGNVNVSRTGTYHSKIHSGGSITINGFCRGGELLAKDKIAVREIGSATNVSTLVGVDEDGVIQGNKVFPNVTFAIGAVLRKNQEELNMVKIKLDDKGNFEFI